MKTTILLLLCTATTLFAQEKFDLSLDWKSGRQYSQKLELQQVMGVQWTGLAGLAAATGLLALCALWLELERLVGRLRRAPARDAA